MQTDRWTMMADKPKTEGDANVITKTKPKTQRPPMYKVLLLNDDIYPIRALLLNLLQTLPAIVTIG